MRFDGENERILLNLCTLHILDAALEVKLTFDFFSIFYVLRWKMQRTSSLRAHYWIEQKVVEDSKHH